MIGHAAMPFFALSAKAATDAARLTVGGAELGVSIAALVALAGIALPGLPIAAAVIAAVALPFHARGFKAALADSAAPAR